MMARKALLLKGAYFHEADEQTEPDHAVASEDGGHLIINVIGRECSIDLSADDFAAIVEMVNAATAQPQPTTTIGPDGVKTTWGVAAGSDLRKERKIDSEGTSLKYWFAGAVWEPSAEDWAKVPVGYDFLVRGMGAAMAFETRPNYGRGEWVRDRSYVYLPNISIPDDANPLIIWIRPGIGETP